MPEPNYSSRHYCSPVCEEMIEDCKNYTSSCQSAMNIYLTQSSRDAPRSCVRLARGNFEKTLLQNQQRFHSCKIYIYKKYGASRVIVFVTGLTGRFDDHFHISTSAELVVCLGISLRGFRISTQRSFHGIDTPVQVENINASRDTSEYYIENTSNFVNRNVGVSKISPQ